jgi:hypothetical protein
MGTSISGTEAGQRQLNGPQTSGRDYRNLSKPQYEITREDDVAVPMRDGVLLLADVFRPTASGRYPVLIAASPYPRQIQDLGALPGWVRQPRRRARSRTASADRPNRSPAWA